MNIRALGYATPVPFAFDGKPTTLSASEYLRLGRTVNERRAAVGNGPWLVLAPGKRLVWVDGYPRLEEIER